MSTSFTRASRSSAPFSEARRVPPRSPSDASGSSESIAGHVYGLLSAIGEDPERDGLRATPERVARGFGHLTRGTAIDPSALLRSNRRRAASSGIVIVRGLEYFSLCERYLLPFFGRAHVAYLPDENAVGESTIVRLVTALASRLQTQERLTRQIQTTLDAVLAPHGVAVLLEARHTALLMHGPETQHAAQVTVATSGAFREPEHRARFDRLVRDRSTI